MTAALDENSGERPVVYPEAYKFINRLSDYLFIAARYVNFRAGKSDIEWQTRETK
jgi:cob(I)alamin adenosyltransferase